MTLLSQTPPAGRWPDEMKDAQCFPTLRPYTIEGTAEAVKGLRPASQITKAFAVEHSGAPLPFFILSIEYGNV